VQRETVVEAIERGRRILTGFSDTPNLDAQLLLGQALGRSRTWIHTYPETELQPSQLAQFDQSLARYQAGEALPYILGWWEFYGRSFRVTPEVLIPRPETELLVDLALRRMVDQTGSVTAVDVGTGSGCVAVTLAAEAPALKLWACDISAQALALAQANARHHSVQARIQFLESDLLTPLSGHFDLICANLPYLTRDDLTHLAVAEREPRIALDGGMDGLESIARLLAQLPGRLRPGGGALIEFGEGQARHVATQAQTLMPDAEIQIHRDLNGLERVLEITAAGYAQVSGLGKTRAESA
jgi:release factor glutamine methyltransferase